MLNATDRATALLHETLQANEKKGFDVLRLTRTADGMGLALSEEREGDQVIQHEDRKVLVIEPELAEALDGSTIDAVETPQGESLVLQTQEGHP